MPRKHHGRFSHDKPQPDALKYLADELHRAWWIKKDRERERAAARKDRQNNR